MKQCEAVNRNSSRQQQDLCRWCGKRRMDREGVSLLWMERRVGRDEVERKGRGWTFRTLCSASDNG